MSRVRALSSAPALCPGPGLKLVIFSDLSARPIASLSGQEWGRDQDLRVAAAAEFAANFR